MISFLLFHMKPYVVIGCNKEKNESKIEFFLIHNLKPNFLLKIIYPLLKKNVNPDQLIRIHTVFHQHDKVISIQKQDQTLF